ncbi:MAG: TetR/AcrR family transcriptional regulator [Candidatus Izemoplasmatales bacterium]|nr:TetR/AcrR family transcriptional regulator [Candidatus Izemoplasmatales bacterium]MDD4070564.1 TetR/AcrR family transcriptional regulator [Candidatus Izemoplasmatales bacterium]
MKNKEEKMKKVFIDATKKVIKEKGLKAVSVREISKISGYSYANLYNYFKDIDSLLTYVAIDYLEESYKEIYSETKLTDNIREKIILASKKYFTYMFDNPSIFKIVFINDYGKEVETVSYKLIPKVTILLRELLSKLKDDQIIIEREVLFELLSASIHSKLMFTIFKRSPLSKDLMLDMIEKEIKILIGE